MTNIDCTTCRTALPDVMRNEHTPAASVSAHLAACVACQGELGDLRRTWELMDAWTAPEPSAYFDARLRARLREAQAAQPAGLWERLTSYLELSTGRGLRPAMTGALALVMLLGGGTAATLLSHHGAALAPSSPTVNDLRIFDNNAQAMEQMDILDEPSAPAEGAPQS